MFFSGFYNSLMVYFSFIMTKKDLKVHIVVFSDFPLAFMVFTHE